MLPLKNEKNSLLNDDEATIYVSKSEIKRDAEIIKRLGLELVKLSHNELSKIPLDDALTRAIELAQKIKKEGYRRQIQYIGKLLRHRDIDPITQALDKLKNRHNQQAAMLHKIERLRDDLIETGDIAPILVLYPQAERQKLHQLARAAKKEQSEEQALKSAKQIFQYLKELSEIK